MADKRWHKAHERRSNWWIIYFILFFYFFYSYATHTTRRSLVARLSEDFRVCVYVGKTIHLNTDAILAAGASFSTHATTFWKMYFQLMAFWWADIHLLLKAALDLGLLRKT